MGRACQIVIHLQRNGLRKCAYPFDATRITFESLKAVLQNDLEDFFTKEVIVPDEKFIEAFVRQGNHAWFPVINTRYNINFPHAFKSREHFLHSFAEVEAAFRRRTIRMFAALDSGDSTLLVRYHISKAEAAELRDIIRRKFPRAHFDVLAINDADVVCHDWQLENVIPYRMALAAGTHAMDPAFDANWRRLYLRVLYTGTVPKLFFVIRFFFYRCVRLVGRLRMRMCDMRGS